MNRNKTLQVFVLIVLGLSLVGMAAKLAPSVFNRWIYDDFCTAASVQARPFGQYLLHEYSGWTGRFSYILFSGLAALAGARFASLLPLLLVCAWYAALIWCLLPLCRHVHARPYLPCAAAFSAFLLTVLFHSLPNFFESVVWETGAINYTLPLVVFSLEAGLFLRAWFEGKRLPLFLTFALVFLAGGFSEIFSLMQIALLASLGVYLLIRKSFASRRQFTIGVLVGLLTAALAFLLVYAAPGNAVRQGASSHPEPAGVVQLPWLVIRAALVEFYSYLIHACFWIFPLFFIPFAFGTAWSASTKAGEAPSPANPKKLFHAVLWLGLFTFGLAVVAALPSAYIQWDAPEPRAMILFFAFFIPAAGCCSYLLGRIAAAWQVSKAPAERLRTQTRAILLLAALLLAAGTALSVQKTIQSLPIQREYAQAWDARDQQLRALRAQGELYAKTPALTNPYAYVDLNDNPKHWVNRCAAAYYGFETLEKNN